jgi:hypothetical protein
LVEEVYDFVLAGASLSTMSCKIPDRSPPLVIPRALWDNAFFTYHAVPRIRHPEHRYRNPGGLRRSFSLARQGELKDGAPG